MTCAIGEENIAKKRYESFLKNVHYHNLLLIAHYWFFFGKTALKF